MNIPFLDLGSAYRELQEEIDAAIHHSISSERFIGGPEVEAFEHEFATYTHSDYCVGVANGLDALHLALVAMGVGEGDEVIVPSNTFIATWLAVSQCGAIPVPVEPDESTFNLDPSKIEAAITDRTRVILPVHLYGQPADMDSVLEIACARGIRVIEDAAQAHGARYKGRPIGAGSDAVAWSFYPAKNLGAFGDGGAVTTNDSVLADRLSLLRNYGSRVKYVHEIRGYNSRLDPMQAAVLRVKLRYLDSWNERRSRIAARYMDELSLNGILLPRVPAWASPAWHLFVIRSAERELLKERLDDLGIGTQLHYPIPPHKQEAYFDSRYSRLEFPIASRMAGDILSLPIGPHMTNQQVDAVISAITDFSHSR